MQYKTINSLSFFGSCVNLTIEQMSELSKGSKRANKKIINSLIKKLLPELYEKLQLNYYNPYEYKKTKNCIIVEHSAIHYFLLIN